MKLWTDNLRSPLALLLFVGVAAIGVGLDLWAKAAAVASLRDTPPYRFIPGWLHFTYTENRGAVFGIAQGAWAIFLVVSIGAILFLGFLFLTSGRARIYQLILGVLLGGVIGNMYDRVVYGYVRDMIHGLPGWTWPDWLVDFFPRAWQPAPGMRAEVFPWIFNLADTYLCVGVAAMLMYSFAVEWRRNRVPTRKTGAGAENDARSRALDASAGQP
jgi:signal peptidase II